ncbi:MBL fold metallo-hydrolase [Harryflintia acetispora]|uniref:L-ascorbate metabolism protein UlaG (Beta-lactamase superfamily) n=1 Tax=Harryflintia acetispora TaxID=1849041 RepID=A0A9X8UK24_9FIRM|nr:MBL fold metallo-hydrolase [Harryflintia acetispora]TCL44177.1 L-ascorbate metabolism protein UlaG (beta-lactamase superfamily) [Harryflintia acetispora]
MPRLYYQGHGSYRITSNHGMVIYVDPFVGGGYEKPADLILVTHQHSDHNRVELVRRAPGCQMITEREALAGGVYHTFTVGVAQIEAVRAENINHDPRECVGYLLTLDGIGIYAAGDTSTTDQMHSFSQRRLDYALLPIDGVYNMGPGEASACARLIGARHSIPVHMKPGALFERACAERFSAPGRIILEPGEEIEL